MSVEDFVALRTFICLGCVGAEYETKGFRDNADTDRAICHVGELGLKLGFLRYVSKLLSIWVSIGGGAGKCAKHLISRRGR